MIITWQQMLNIIVWDFLADGTPSVRTFANTKDIEKENEKYIVELKQKGKRNVGR